MDAAATGFTQGKSWAVGIALLMSLLAIALVLLKYPGKRKEMAFFVDIAEQSRREAASVGSLPS